MSVHLLWRLCVAAVRDFADDNMTKILDVELKPKSHWSVRLGSQEWTKYTYARPSEDSLRLLGSARRGLQSGALARLDDEFVLVVGDHVTHLSHADSKQIAAMSAQARTMEPAFVGQPVPARVAPPVVVVIKRRRVPVPL